MPRRVNVLTVVVAYNAYRAGFFPRCLHAIEQLRLRNEELEINHQILVVDNTSADGTRDRLRKEFPHLELHISQENLGYAGGNNVGFEKALAYGADFVAVITQDVLVEDTWLLESVTAMLADEQIGIVQPLLLLWPEQGLINSTGNATHMLGYGYARDYRLPRDQGPKQAIMDIPYASGAVILLRAKALRDVGFFDDEMWMYNEDQDLGWRMWLANYRNVMATRAIAYHQYEFSRSISKVYFMDRNRIIVLLQNYHWLTWLFIWPAFVINEIATFFLAWSGGWWREKLRVWRYFLRRGSWRLIWRKRRLRQKSRVRKEREIFSMFTGKILFQDVQSPLITYVANPVLNVYKRLVQLIMFW